MPDDPRDAEDHRRLDPTSLRDSPASPYPSPSRPPKAASPHSETPSAKTRLQPDPAPRDPERDRRRRRHPGYRHRPVHPPPRPRDHRTVGRGSRNRHRPLPARPPRHRASWLRSRGYSASERLPDHERALSRADHQSPQDGAVRAEDVIEQFRYPWMARRLPPLWYGEGVNFTITWLLGDWTAPPVDPAGRGPYSYDSELWPPGVAGRRYRPFDSRYFSSRSMPTSRAASPSWLKKLCNRRLAADRLAGRASSSSTS